MSAKLTTVTAEQAKRLRSRTDSERVDAFTDAELTANALSDPDNPPLDDAFWASTVRHDRPSKKQITLRLDAEIVDWFKLQGTGYQTRMNAVLKAYKEAKDRHP